MKSFHHSSGDDSVHFLVEQEAAIDDYLAGLLKDIGTPTDALFESHAAAPSEHKGRKTPPISLSIVARASATQMDSSGDEPAVLDEPWTAEGLVETAVGPLSLDLPDEAGSESGAPPTATSIRTPESDAQHEAIAVDSVSVDPDEAVGAISERISAAPPETPWRIFSAGVAKVGLPTSEIHTVVADASIDPLKGAPAHVAGTILHQGRRRMVLSLSSWFPVRSSSTTQHVILLGPEGLWGVQVGAELTEIPWDEAQTHWRTDAERESSRPWLAGVNRSSGLAFLTVSALRAALKSPRSSV